MIRRRSGTVKRLRCLYLLPCFAIFACCVTFVQRDSDQVQPSEEYTHGRSRNLLSTNGSRPMCIPSGIHSFPRDFFSQEVRLSGGVAVHFLVLLYACAMIAVVCDDYFIPSLEIISDKLMLPSDVAGATFMAIGTSAPELYSSITGSFITEGDIGIGTVIGSAVFNMLAVTGLVGLTLWDEELDLDWYPVTRDCSVYAVTVAVLVWVIFDGMVTWWESLLMLTPFATYILIMYFNISIEKCIKQFAKTSCNSRCCRNRSEEEQEEATPLLQEKAYAAEIKESKSIKERDSFSVELIPSEVKAVLEKSQMTAKIDDILWGLEFSTASGALCSRPEGGAWSFVWWIVMWPASLLYFVTIPDCNAYRFRKLFPLTFFMSVLWIGALSYIAVWMVTVIGYTFSIPDSISGLTLLAAGTSVPEIMSSIIVAKGGLGNMAISNLVGSNTFDISFCLGAPWLVKALMTPHDTIRIDSVSLTYTTVSLFVTLLVFVAILRFCRWKLSRSVGIAFLLLYLLFAALACLYALNVFGDVNLPTCRDIGA